MDSFRSEELPAPDVSATNFAFLTGEWPAFFESAAKAEALAYPDPRPACFYARRALELAVAWVYESDAPVFSSSRASRR
jgi:hypothetical protein